MVDGEVKWEAPAGLGSFSNNVDTVTLGADGKARTAWIATAPGTGEIKATGQNLKDPADHTTALPDATTNIAVNVLSVDLKIHRADSDPSDAVPYGALVDEADEETIGSFTVANLNDTDGDGVEDLNDTDGVVVGANGHDEMDLMRLILSKPSVDLGGTVTLRIVSGDVKIWESSNKMPGTEVTQLTRPLSDFTTDHDGDGVPDLEWWVEARSPTALRGIELTYEYTPPGSGVTCSDTVKATAIGATVTHVVTDTLTPAEVDALLGSDWVANGGVSRNNIQGDGGTGVGTAGGGHNSIVLEFTITPADISTVPIAHRPRFDISRQIFGTTFQWSPGGAPPAFGFPGNPHPHFPAQNEEANDDPPSEGDETDEPTALGHIWSDDVPGGNPVGVVLSIHRNNFQEFLRVRFDGVDPAGNTTSGTRCSSKQPWHSKTTISTAFSSLGPNEIGSGNFAFQREALTTTTTVGTTTPGTRHDAFLYGLDVAAAAGAVAENVSLRLIDVDSSFNDLLHAVAPTPLFGKLASTQVGDQLAYTVTGHFASRLNGTIVGPDGSSGETEAELAHEFAAGGAISTQTTVTGTAFSQPAPTVPAMVLGAITHVTITGGGVEANSNAGGTQAVSLRIVDADSLSDDLLDAFSFQAPRQMLDELGATVPAIKDAVMKFSTAVGRIASKANGDVIGPSGSSGETTAEIAYEFSSGGANSPEVSVTGPAFSMAAPAIGTNPIPFRGTSTVTLNGIYIEATGATGNEVFPVRIIDADAFSDDVLQTINVTLPRPAGCFSGALIGPVTPPVVGTLKNSPPPAPGGIGIVKGPSGSSGEHTAQIGYEIGASGSNSPTVNVTASNPGGPP